MAPKKPENNINKPVSSETFTRDIFAIESFKNIQDLIKFTDQKAGFLMVLHGLKMGLFIELVKNLDSNSIIRHWTKLKCFEIIFLLSGIFFAGFFVYQMIYILNNIIRPRLSTTSKTNFYYFLSIAKLDENSFLTEHKNMLQINMYEQILMQLYAVSKIMNEKTEHLNKSIGYFNLSLSIFIISIISFLIIKYYK